jgi:hypothetical protein
MPLRPEQIALMEAQVAKLRAAAPDAAFAPKVTGTWTYLQQSETKLIQLMSGNHPPDNAPGSIDVGFILYLLHQLPTTVVDFLKWLGMPPSAITPAILQSWSTQLQGAGVVGSDGTLIQESKYAAFDLAWAFAVFEYIYYLKYPADKAPFQSPGTQVTISSPSTIKIALTGDWGTGVWNDQNLPQCPSQAVLEQIQSANPDVVIHLGDVYYAGTECSLITPHEEADNLVNLWPNFEYSFTLNSNHEMYGGGNGYFNVAMPSQKFANTKSFFSIEFQDWLILGLDSAYYDPSMLYMNGAVVDSNQINFIKSFDLTGKKVMVLTHHNAITTDGQQKMSLWNDVSNALGRPPDYWYWGHVHNGIVYSSNSAAGSTTKARCLGHGALPFGNAYALHDNSGNPIPQVLYYTHDPVPNPNHNPQLDNRVLNGYAVLTLTANSITEDFYDQDGVKKFTQSEQLEEPRLSRSA